MSLPVYSVEIDNETVDFLALTNDRVTDEVIEMDFVRLMVRLRTTDTEAYERLWELGELFEERGPALDALEG